MIDSKIIKALKDNRYEVSSFENKEQAADYIVSQFDGVTIGFGDSETLKEMNLYQRLSEKNTVYDPLQAEDYPGFLDLAEKALTTDYFFTSVNGLSEDGIIVNLDGTGNRVAGSIFRHKKTFYVVGKNKISRDLDKTIWRVRNVAAPRNAHRLKYNTPCALHGEKCYDCSSTDRICNGLFIGMKKMLDIDMEVVLIDEELGY